MQDTMSLYNLWILVSNVFTVLCWVLWVSAALKPMRANVKNSTN